MAVYEITNVENTGPTSHKKTYQRSLYSIHRKTQRDPNVLTKTFLVDTKKWDSNIVMIINSHIYVKILDLSTVLNQIICDHRSGNFYTRTQTWILW